jgi:hypothetical protein
MGVKRKNETIEANGLFGVFWGLENETFRMWKIVLESHQCVEVL